ncbi:response regulator [Alsobacter sp. SYSU BS001988]
MRWLDRPGAIINPTLSVLIVDDFAPMRTILESMLVEIGVVDFDGAANVASALTRIHARRYDLVPLDSLLGDKPATFFCKRWPRIAKPFG